MAAGVGLLLLGLGGWAVWSALPGEETLSKTASQLPEGVGFAQRLDSTVPRDLTFVDDQGNSLTLGELFNNQPVILNLVYFECPMLCNLSMDGLIRTLNTMTLRVGEEFQVVTVSFDPREGPERAAAAKRTTLSRYTHEDSAAGWHFLTGEQAAIEQLADAVGFGYAFDENTGQFAHAAGVVVVTPQGRISRYLGGVDYAARDIRLSLVEASAGRIGSATDQALLLCYRYDPLTGKYGLAITRAIRFAGLLTVVALVGGISWAVRREAVQQPAERLSSHDEVGAL